MIRISLPATTPRIAAFVALTVLVPTTARTQGGTQANSTRATDFAPAVRIDSLLDLPTVVRRALQFSPAVTQGQSGIRIARSEGRVARGAYLPSLSAVSSATRGDVLSSPPVGVAQDNSYSAGLQSSVDLFTGGRRGADEARASADLLSAQATDINQQYQVTLVAERAFYEALRGGDLVTVGDARVSRAETGLRYAQDRMRAGTATKSDELRARLELTGARQQTLAARDTLQSAAFALGRLVGADGPVGARRPPSLDPRPLALADSAIIRLAISAAPSVQASEAATRASEAAVQSARSYYLPDIKLIGGYNWANQSVLLGAQRPGWQVALATSFPLFNGFQREDVIARSEAVADVARVTAQDETRFVRAESERLLSALRFAEQNIALAAEAVAAAQEDLRVETERYRAGIATVLDQLTSELAVTQAELGLVAARYNYQVARATLEALVGRAL